MTTHASDSASFADTEAAVPAANRDRAVEDPQPSLSRFPIALVVWILAISLLQLVAARAADVAVKTAEQPVPKEVGAAIAKELQPKAFEVLERDKPIYEFWFRKEVPLKAKPDSPDKSLDAIDEVTLLGAVKVGEGQRDYKDNEIAPGVYTVRFGLQPQDGDHLGTSEFPYFAVLVPAAGDQEPDGIRKVKSMTKASGKGTATGHPVVLSLRPASAEANDVTITKPKAGHEAIHVTLPGKAADSSDPAKVTFDLVFKGKYNG